MSASAAPGLSTPAEFLGGRILIAMPGIDDQRFERTVLLVCQHNEELAMGIALNQPVEGLSLPDLLQRLGVKSGGQAQPASVLMGGPVERERGHVLHTDDYASPGSTIAVAEGVALTATRDVLDALSDQIRRPRRATLALGYAGWGAGQLEREIQESVWLICEPDEELLFGDRHEAKWAHALSKIGVSASQLSAQAGRA